MDLAKAIINIKDGIIELSGSVDFVRQYLDRYQSALETVPEKAPVAPEAKAVKAPTIQVARAVKEPAAAVASPVAKSVKEPAAPETAPVVSAAAPVAAKPKPETCIGAIRTSIQSGFFNQPRSFSDVRHHLDEDKFDYSQRVVRAGLTRLAKVGTLRMTGKGRGKRYSRPE
jgi:hypothetical protein